MMTATLALWTPDTTSTYWPSIITILFGGLPVTPTARLPARGQDELHPLAILMNVELWISITPDGAREGFP